MPRLADYGTKDRDAVTLRLEDLGADEVIIQGCDIRQGNWGDFAVLDVLKDTGELVTVITGSLFVLDALKDAIKEEAFPVSVKFFKKGRTWLFE